MVEEEEGVADLGGSWRAGRPRAAHHVGQKTVCVGGGWGGQQGDVGEECEGVVWAARPVGGSTTVVGVRG